MQQNESPIKHSFFRPKVGLEHSYFVHFLPTAVNGLPLLDYAAACVIISPSQRQRPWQRVSAELLQQLRLSLLIRSSSCLLVNSGAGKGLKKGPKKTPPLDLLA